MGFFDETQEVAEVEDLLEEGRAYNFTIVDVQEKKDVVISKDAPAGIRGKMLSQIAEPDRSAIHKEWVSDYVEVRFKPDGTEGEFAIKESFPSRKLAVGKDGEPRNAMTRLVKALGGDVGKGKTIRPSAFIRNGNKINAVVKKEEGRDGKKYSRLVVESFKPVAGATRSATLPVDDATMQDIVKAIKGAASRTDALKKLNQSGRSDLIAPLLNYIDSGAITFPVV
jgi:hypothetical protein